MSTHVGTWMLVKATSTAADGAALPLPYGGQPMGRLTLTADGRMMAVTCDGRLEVSAGVSRDFSSYCGTYKLEGKTLTTTVFAASDPSRIGGDQVRDVRFEGKLMVLRPPLRPYGSKPPEQRELWWERISEV